MVDCLLSDIKIGELVKLYSDREHIIFKHTGLSRMVIYDRLTNRFCSVSYFH